MISRQSLKNLIKFRPGFTPTGRNFPLTAKIPVSEERIKENWRGVSSNTIFDGKRISDIDGVALYSLIWELRPQSTLEVGYFSGASTIAISAALRDIGLSPSAQHVALDLENFNGGQENVQAAGLEGFCRFVHGDSALTLPQLVQENKAYDFAFIDGNHRFDFCLIDFFFCDRLLRSGGVLAFHDARTAWPAVDKVLAFVESNRAYESLGRVQGLQLYRKLRSDFTDGKFDRDARVFVDF